MKKLTRMVNQQPLQNTAVPQAMTVTIYVAEDARSTPLPIAYQWRKYVSSYMTKSNTLYLPPGTQVKVPAGLADYLTKLADWIKIV